MDTFQHGRHVLHAASLSSPYAPDSSTCTCCDPFCNRVHYIRRSFGPLNTATLGLPWYTQNKTSCDQDTTSLCSPQMQSWFTFNACKSPFDSGKGPQKAQVEDTVRCNTMSPYLDFFPAIHQQEAYLQDSPTTLEPSKIFRQDNLYPYDEYSRLNSFDFESVGYTDGSVAVDYDSSPYEAASGAPNGLLSDHDNSPQTADASPSSMPCKEMEEGDTADKPYARLIYKALLEAPGHKMMLRDIYEWFMRNTSKPQESGTNGWQNSIRHNLSMNQAFENERCLSPCRGQSRKANSMWMLTEHAVKYGVQSTTRYRKTGQVKRGALSQTSTVQRQRSGARGGRSTRRRMAYARKQSQDLELAKRHDQTITSDTPDADGDQALTTPIEDSMDQSPLHELPLATPAGNCKYEPLYALPTLSHEHDSDKVLKSEYLDFLDESVTGSDYVLN